MGVIIPVRRESPGKDLHESPARHGHPGIEILAVLEMIRIKQANFLLFDVVSPPPFIEGRHIPRAGTEGKGNDEQRQ